MTVHSMFSAESALYSRDEAALRLIYTLEHYEYSDDKVFSLRSIPMAKYFPSKDDDLIKC